MKMSRKLFICLTLSLLPLLWPETAQAQRFRWWMDDRFQRELAITPDQTSRIDAIFQAVNVDAKFFFIPDSFVQPYISAGGSYPWLTIEDGSAADESLEVLGDSRWRGWGVNLEAGVGIYPHPQVGILAGYAYKAIWFDRASGVSDRLFDLRPRFRETSNGFSITAAFTF